MYLIDTSVWIDSLRGLDNGPVRFFQSLIAERIRYGITGVIYQEVLQGARGRASFDRLRAHLRSLMLYHPLDSVETYAEAAHLYRHCRARAQTDDPLHLGLSDRPNRHRAWLDPGPQRP